MLLLDTVSGFTYDNFSKLAWSPWVCEQANVSVSASSKHLRYLQLNNTGHKLNANLTNYFQPTSPRLSRLLQAPSLTNTAIIWVFSPVNAKYPELNKSIYYPI